MCDLTAQLLKHLSGIAEVTGSNPVEALIYFRLFLPIALRPTFIQDSLRSFVFVLNLSIVQTLDLIG